MFKMMKQLERIRGFRLKLCLISSLQKFFNSILLLTFIWNYDGIVIFEMSRKSACIEDGDSGTHHFSWAEL